MKHRRIAFLAFVVLVFLPCLGCDPLPVPADWAVTQANIVAQLQAYLDQLLAQAGA